MIENIEAGNYYWCRHLKDKPWRVVLVDEEDGKLMVWTFLQAFPVCLEELEPNEYEWIKLDYPE